MPRKKGRRNGKGALFRARQVLGKYRIQRRLSSGGFATVYAAMDRIEGVPVALKIPHPHLVTDEALEIFRKEARITAGLDHPNILPIKNADLIDGHFIIASPLGEQSLTERLRYRISTLKVLSYAEQLMEGMAYAHGRRILHCDLKPDNLILFPGNRLRITDFGIARVALRTMMSASGSGTLGYIAPEQAMGKLSFRSDCFSIGLVIYRMLTGQLPKWPYRWPPQGSSVLRGKVNPDLIAFLRRAIEVEEHRRFRDARQMLRAWHQIKPRVMAHQRRRRYR